ncbi:kinase-like protein [Trichocladium antarcticum]|uniref:Kinase-like protein n=1 Tax=Trichocladium antarcticum TaxID=1450529 RepID=A0AAN6UM43_9PEZI|nr:kinase-like protein [Trichocladium antarcticum]
MCPAFWECALTVLRSSSAPPDVQSFPSPMRHHKRTPSAHREIKETLNARSEYTNDESEGYSHRRINQYVIKDEIGRGSFGAVHLATDQFGNEYAVKEFSKARLRRRAQSNILRHGPRGRAGRYPPRAGFGAPDVPHTGFADQQAKEAQDALWLIREEVAIMKKLNHPNLVQLIEVLDDPDDDSVYMVLEMCKKGVVMNIGLGEATTPYPEEQCRLWFRDLILGIEYLHSQGVVHRDIKPDNLLLTDDDILKIVDFGVSEMFEKSGQMRTAKSAGSPAFLPPELCVAKHGDVSGPAADIWSMGVSLYCLHYGRIPFEREGVLEMYEAIRTETPELPVDENPDFVDLMRKLLEKDPEKRITMAELREHSWVTKGGTDPLLSAEENCSDPVEPNPLELNHAFTRRMSHLICVMKAISKFKGLLSPKPPTKPAPPSTTHPLAHHPTTTTTTTTTLPPTPPPEPATQPVAPPPPSEQSTAEVTARILREREHFLRSRDPLSAHRRSPSTTIATAAADGPQPLLGIGTGGLGGFGGAEDDDMAAAHVVADSPTVVDFNVYDRAFEDALERIKVRRAGSWKGRGVGGGGDGRRGGGGLEDGGPQAPVYHTRLNERSHYTVGDEDLTWAAGRAGEKRTPRSLFAARQGQGQGQGQGQRSSGPGIKLADLVAQAVEGAREGKAAEGPVDGGGDGGGRGQGQGRA